MKHKICCALICCVLLFSLAVSVGAEETTEYRLDEIGMTISPSSDYIIFTRDTDENDPNLVSCGWKKDDLLESMYQDDVYIYGENKYRNRKLAVFAIDSSLPDFSQSDASALLEMKGEYEAACESAGMTVLKSEMYQHAQTSFIRLYTSQPRDELFTYGLHYYTQYGDKVIIVQLRSYWGEICKTDEDDLKALVDSIVFSPPPQETELPAVPADSDTYTDGETGAAFTVPEDWEEAPQSGMALPVSESAAPTPEDDSKSEERDSAQTFDPAHLLLSLLLTIAVYSLPIILYRYAVRKKPLDRETARTLTIIYGICAFLAAAAIVYVRKAGGASVGAIIFWSWVNYRMLIGGKESKARGPVSETPETPSDRHAYVGATEKQTPGERMQPKPAADISAGETFVPKKPAPEEPEGYMPEIRYCHKCGERLHEDSLFCGKCGTPVAKE